MVGPSAAAGVRHQRAARRGLEVWPRRRPGVPPARGAQADHSVTRVRQGGVRVAVGQPRGAPPPPHRHHRPRAAAALRGRRVSEWWCMPNDDGASLAQMLMTLFSASNYAGKSLNKGAIAVLRPGSAHRPEVLQYEASHVSEAEVDLRNVLFLGQARARRRIPPPAAARPTDRRPAPPPPPPPPIAHAFVHPPPLR